MNVTDVGEFLRKIGLEMYMETFRRNAVNGQMLALFDSIEELEELGVTLSLHKKYLLEKINELKINSGWLVSC